MYDNNYHQAVEESRTFYIVTMCGSTKFKEEYLKTIGELTYQGNLVLFCPIFHHADGIKSPDAITGQVLIDIHMQRIRMCDGIFVINKNGYIGNSTRREIEYAKRLGKGIRYLEPIIEEEEKEGVTENGLE